MPNTPSQRQTRSNSNPNPTITLSDIKTLIETALNKKMDPLEKKLDKLTDSINVIFTRMDEIERKYSELENRCREIEEEKVIMFAEMEERQKRKANLIVSGIPEKENGSVEERRRWDEASIKALLHDLNNFASDAVVATHRIGKTDSRKPRLLKIVCRNVETKRTMLMHAKNLRSIDHYKGVYINPDMTPLEQNQNRTLREECKRRRAIGEDVLIKHGKVVSRQNFR